MGIFVNRLNAKLFRQMEKIRGEKKNNRNLDNKQGARGMG